MLTVTSMEWNRLPEVLVTTMLVGPTVAALEAVRVRTLVVVALAGLKDAVTPEGRPPAASATVPLKPLNGVTVIVLVPLAPWTTLAVVADNE
jgi:hypothetical protein